MRLDPSQGMNNPMLYHYFVLSHVYVVIALFIINNKKNVVSRASVSIISIKVTLKSEF